MKASRISPIICAVIASAIAACSGDTSLPTEPGSALHREAQFIGSSADGSDASSGGVQDGGSQPGDGQGGVNPSADNPNPNPNPAPPPGGSQSVQRPFGEFLREQGTFCFDDGMGGCQQFNAPTANHLTWFDQERRTSIGIDYAGLVQRWSLEHGGSPFGTQIFGTVEERIREDGRTLVTVTLKGANVMAFAVRGLDWNGEPWFGFGPKEVVDPQFPPAIGDVSMTITFLNSAPGALLPDLVQLIRAPGPGQQLLSIRMDYAGNGEMRSGSGMEGQKSSIVVTYDGSRGPVMPENPEMPGRGTGPTGFVTAQYSAQAAE